MSIEKRIEFSAQADWVRWREQTSGQWQVWRKQVLATVSENGLETPLMGLPPARPVDIKIDPNNLRESVSHQGLNSRKRALLLELRDQLWRVFGESPLRKAKIFAPEGVTSLAMKLRARFPYFLGSEYLPTEEDREFHFPVPHVDLQKIPYKACSFDVVLSADVLEHVPDIAACIREQARILKPGGSFIATFPFRAAESGTLVRAVLEGGKINNVMEPEFHGNPVDAHGGSLVFSVPGWDVLDMMRDAKLENCCMVMRMSSRFGVVSNPLPGVFICVGRKPVDLG